MFNILKVVSGEAQAEARIKIHELEYSKRYLTSRDCGVILSDYKVAELLRSGGIVYAEDLIAVIKASPVFHRMREERLKQEVREKERELKELKEKLNNQ